MHVQVKQLWKDVKYHPKEDHSYKDSWDLRRLYTFCFRRQLDAFKREQTPRDRTGSLILCIVEVYKPVRSEFRFML